MVEKQASTRLAELDALRGIAALIVVLFHYTWQVTNIYPAARPIGWGLPWGQYGVELFFGISGFVIFMTLDRTRSAADFAVSRFARLFPAYWAGIAATSLGVLALGAHELAQTPATILVNLTMLQGYLYMPSVDGVYWSLTIELGFYACMLALWRLRLLDRIELVLIGWLTLKIVWWVFPELPSRLSALLVLRYLPFFVVGIACYRVHIGARRWVDQRNVLLAALMTVCLVDEPEKIAVFLGVLTIFALFVNHRLGFLARRPLLWLGALSYPLYLVHQNLGYGLIAWLEQHGASPELALVATIAAALALAQAIHVLVEKPSLALIRRFWSERRTPAPA